MDLKLVPVELRQFTPYVNKWGEVDDVKRARLRKRAASNPNEMRELKKFAATFGFEQMDIFDDWCDRNPITKCPESSKFYFALMLLDELGILDCDKGRDTVDYRIQSLGKFGSYRLASKRMWAARFLVLQHKKEAWKAISALRKALNDEDGRVRVWSHYALWVIDSKDEKHIEAIRAALKDSDADVANEAAAALGAIGPDASRVVPDLIEKLYKDQDNLFFIGALGVLGVKSQQAEQVLQVIARSDVDHIRKTAIEALEVLRRHR